jgi:acetate kinase
MGIVLALNCGSSSLKYAAFDGEEALHRGSVEEIGHGEVRDHAAAVHRAFEELARCGVGMPVAVGHRLVHGGPDHVLPARVDAALLASLEAVVPFAPLHLPVELRAIDAVALRFPSLPQVACFDTAFHAKLPMLARRFPLPDALYDVGIRRYGFHGLSYEYVLETLGPERLGRSVLAHLGNGASMAAVALGTCFETTMAFTPTAGLVMGSRSGDLDPGLLVYLLRHRGYDADALERLVEHEAGLLALSGLSSDMRVLLARRATDPRAELAVSMFCYQARKWVGALAAVLGGLDSLVFTGGIGEHAQAIRQEICAGLEHLGVVTGEPESGPCRVYTVHTDEERMIVRHTRRLIGASELPMI